MEIGRAAVVALFFVGILAGSGIHVASVEARCCERDNGGCDGASETGCAAGSVQNMFFPDPCVCSSGSCVDPTQNNDPCGGTPSGDCGDGVVDSGEDCDEGSENGSFMSCCAVDCSYKANGAACDDGTFCDGLGACDGSGACIENNGPPTCPIIEQCDEEDRSCGVASTPTTSAGVLTALAVAMLAAATLVLQRRRAQQRH